MTKAVCAEGSITLVTVDERNTADMSPADSDPFIILTHDPDINGKASYTFLYGNCFESEGTISPGDDPIFLRAGGSKFMIKHENL